MSLDKKIEFMQTSLLKNINNVSNNLRMSHLNQNDVLLNNVLSY